jgi:pimeloyl-ACP methyl ester carboxylesterase
MRSLEAAGCHEPVDPATRPGRRRRHVAAQLQALAAWRSVVSDVHTRCDTIPDMAAALLAEHEGDLILCGASMGGMVAMEAARQAPERIAGLALLGTTARPETEEMRTLREAPSNCSRRAGPRRSSKAT